MRMYNATKDIFKYIKVKTSIRQVRFSYQGNVTEIGQK